MEVYCQIWVFRCVLAPVRAHIEPLSAAYRTAKAYAERYIEHGRARPLVHIDKKRKGYRMHESIYALRRSICASFHFALDIPIRSCPNRIDMRLLRMRVSVSDRKTPIYRTQKRGDRGGHPRFYYSTIFQKVNG